MSLKSYKENGKCPPTCHKCCSDVLVASQDEINIIKRYIQNNNIEWKNPNSKYLFAKDAKYVNVCPLLGENGECLVYPVRTEECRHFECDGSKSQTPFNHADKHVISMLMELDPGAFIPNKDGVKTLIQTQEYFYQTQKEKKGLSTTLS